jgi:hypothetical protein
VVAAAVPSGIGLGQRIIDGLGLGLGSGAGLGIWVGLGLGLEMINLPLFLTELQHRPRNVSCSE